MNRSPLAGFDPLDDNTPNSLNEYSQRTVPGYVDIKGISIATNTVTVAGLTAYRKGEYFRQELSVNNSSAALWTNIVVAATGQTSASGNLFVAQTPESYAYDLDGNLTQDGRWTYSWDAENRLVAMAANTGVGPQISLKYDYDAQCRRIRKQVWSNKTWSGSPTNDLRFVYDSWNLIGIFNSSFSLLNSYVWGTDLSGSAQGAGGVGGLLAAVNYGVSTNFVAFDGNGNIAALVRTSDGTVTANYEYGPFGEVIRATGPMAKANPFRFSTKYQDDESDLVYYGYRFYNQSNGRWLARDQLEEDDDGGNLYAFVENSPPSNIDALGHYSIGPGRNIYVSKCEIVIIYGHGNPRRKLHWTWHMPSRGCGGGTAITCWPTLNASGIDDPRNLWLTWGGHDVSTFDIITWSMSASGPDFYQPTMLEPNANKVLRMVTIAAISKKQALCRSCGCKSVSINYIEVGHKLEIIEPKRELGGVPIMTDLQLPCYNLGTGNCH